MPIQLDPAYPLLTKELLVPHPDLGKDNDDGSLNDFLPGRIHMEAHLQFWESTLKANDWVLSTLKLGYILPLVQEPPQYEEQNNASARINHAFVEEEVEKLLKQGVIRLATEKPHCVSPLSVAERKTKDGIKRRLCWDGSRLINLHLEKQRVTLSPANSTGDNRPRGFSVQVRPQVCISSCQNI